MITIGNEGKLGLRVEAEFWDLIVIRGDLRSHYGYGKALRAHAQLLSQFTGRMIGVDLHYHPKRAQERFQWEILSDKEVDREIERTNGRILFINYTTPDGFRRHPRAYNVCLFYWETDRFQQSLGWAGKIQLMDEVWIPAEYMRPLISGTGFSGPIECIPWPQVGLDVLAGSQQEVSVERKNSKGISVFKVPDTDKKFFPAFVRGLILTQQVASRVPFLGKAFAALRLHRRYGVRAAQNFIRPLEELIRTSGAIHLAVVQHTPRKGLLLLVSEWIEKVRLNPEGRSVLIIKSGSLNLSLDQYDLYFELMTQITRLAKPLGIAETRIYLALDYLTEAQIALLYQSINGGLLSCTLGEGFGGPVVEAALREIPVICPRHSALADLIPADYPFSVPFDLRKLSMRHLLHVYSLSSTWGLVRPGGMAKSILQFEKLTAQGRRAVALQLKEFVINKCGWKAVTQTVQDLLPKWSERVELHENQRMGTLGTGQTIKQRKQKLEPGWFPFGQRMIEEQGQNEARN